MSKKIIYLFGPDGAGKTVLANAFSEATKGHVLHSTYSSTWNQEEYHADVIKAATILSQYQTVVLDRWAIDGEIYAKVFRDKETYNVDNLVNDYKDNIVFIYCRPVDIVERFKLLKNRRKEMFDDMADVVKEFDKYVDNSTLKIYKYDFSSSNMYDFVMEILSKYNKELMK